MKQDKIEYPIRINRYIALKGFATRREADKLVTKGFVFVNQKVAKLGQKVFVGDKVELKNIEDKIYTYLAYYKPRGMVTHSAINGEKGVAENFKSKGLFPIGRLDKESEGLIILTDDARITERLLSPDKHHTKVYTVTTQERIRSGIPGILEKGMDTHLYGKLRPAKSKIIGDSIIQIELTEGKKHQIRVMLDELHLTVKKLKRIQICNIKIGNLRPGQSREILDDELKKFLNTLEL